VSDITTTKIIGALLVLGLIWQGTALAGGYATIDKFKVYVNGEFVGQYDIYSSDTLTVDVNPGDVIKVKVYYNNRGDRATRLALTPPRHITGHKTQYASVPAHKKSSRTFNFDIISTYRNEVDLGLTIEGRSGQGGQVLHDACHFYSSPT